MKQEDLCEFKDSLVYTGISSQPVLSNETPSILTYSLQSARNLKISKYLSLKPFSWNLEPRLVLNSCAPKKDPKFLMLCLDLPITLLQVWASM